MPAAGKKEVNVLDDPELRKEIDKITELKWAIESVSIPRQLSSMGIKLSDKQLQIYKDAISSKIEQRLEHFQHQLSERGEVIFESAVRINPRPKITIAGDLKIGMKQIIALERAGVEFNLSSMKIASLLSESYLSQDQFKEGAKFLNIMKQNYEKLEAKEVNIDFRFDDLEFNLLHKLPSSKRSKDQSDRYAELQKTHKPGATDNLLPGKNAFLNDKTIPNFEKIVSSLAGSQLLNLTESLPQTANAGKAEKELHLA